MHSWFDSMSWVKIIPTISKIFLGDIFTRLLCHTKNSTNLLSLSSKFTHTILKHIISLPSGHHVSSMVKIHIHLGVVHHLIVLWWSSRIFVYVYWLVHFLVLLWSNCSWLRTTYGWLSSVLTGSWRFNSVARHLCWHWRYLSGIVCLHLVISRFRRTIFLSDLPFHMLHTLLSNNLSSCWPALSSTRSFTSFHLLLNHCLISGLRFVSMHLRSLVCNCLINFTIAFLWFWLLLQIRLTSWLWCTTSRWNSLWIN